MKPVQLLLLAAIRVYRLVISPMKAGLFGPLGRCRFTPSCSTFALEAVRTHGPWRGSWLAARRICRCHPWGGCGLDPVPATRHGTRNAEPVVRNATLPTRDSRLARPHWQGDRAGGRGHRA